MSWIIEGAKKAVEMDFKVPLPKVVEDAIEAYREDNDWMGHFLLTAVTLIRMLRRSPGNCIRHTGRTACRMASYQKHNGLLFSDRKGRFCQTQDAFRNYGSWPEPEGRTGLPGLMCRSCRSIE